MTFDEYLKQIKIAAEDISRICKETVEKNDSWSSLKARIHKKIKDQDDLFKALTGRCN